MAFGGWAGGGGGGGIFAGGQGTQQGLPFGGIPEEMRPGVERLLVTEPEHREAGPSFAYRESDADRRRLTLRALVLAHRNLAALVIGLVAFASVTAQAGPLLIEYGIDDGMLRHDLLTVGVITAVFVAVVALSALSQRWQVMAAGRLAAAVMHDLRVRIFAHLQRLGLDFYTEEKAGVVMTRMTSDIENLNQLLNDGLAQLLTQAVTMVVVGALLVTINLRLALITFVIVVPALTVLSVWFRSASARGYLRVRDGIATVLADLSESLHGVRVVIAHNRQAHNLVHHRNLLGDYRRAYVYTARISAIYGPGSQLLGYLGQAALLAIGGDMVLHHQLSLGGLVAFFLYLNRFFQPIQLLVQQYTTFQQGSASIVKLNSLLDLRPSVNEAEGAEDLPPVRGEVSFEHVTFGYDPAEPVLHDVCFRVAAGSTVAFVGQTGAGKSTVAKLLTRFYDPTAGRVLIDGHDIARVGIASLRGQLGLVPQEPFLFAGSLRENIAFANPLAGARDVAEAVEAVGLDDLVARLPDGMDTPVHERGQSLSSGERQLIALARAFLAQPRVLILDEATSNLDLASESRIEAALERLLQGRTAILIAHRLSTAMKADRIVVMEAGRVVEEGSHAELVSSGGRYAAMYATWIRDSAGRAA